MIRPGRPTLCRPEQCVLARQHCQQGASNDALARLPGVAPRNIDNWTALAAAVREGRAVAEAGKTRRAGKKGRKGRNPKNLDRMGIS